MPWKIQVVGLPPDRELEAHDSRTRARAVATEHDVAAVVWLARAHAGHVLWLYDQAQDRVSLRPLPSGPPFADPDAAAVALSIKTLLRNSTVIPPDARSKPAPQPVPTPQPGPLLPRPDRLRSLRLEAGTGARLGQQGGPRTAPRFALAIEWQPAPHRPYALALELGLGAGVTVDQGVFAGSFSDTVIAARAHRAFALTPRLSALIRLGPSLHITRLAGFLGNPESAVETCVDVRRINPAMDTGVALRARIGSAVAGELRLIGSYLPRRQRYLADGRPVLTLPRTSLELGVAVTALLPW